MQPHNFWQSFDAEADAPPYRERFPARMPDGRVLHLPIRAWGDGQEGIASLILTQASFSVETALADALAEALKDTGAEVLVGMPTLGLPLARAVAERLGHSRYVALGTSRKFWYEGQLSVPLSSITSPDATKRLYLDPRMRPLLAGRIALIDDVISSGRSICAGIALLRQAGVTPVALGAAMLQTRKSLPPLQDLGLDPALRFVFETPLLRRTPSGWQADQDCPPHR
ncbi:MAG: phosphoribosyltransferase [Pseudomonadota bacterium]